MTQVLAISGPAGVGKSTVAYEASAQLKRAGVAHAVIDTDALDDIFPVPDDLARLSERNLAAVWASFVEHGANRLILTGVYLHRPAELEWIRRAVPNADVTLVQLTASDATLAERVRRREIGTGGDAQLERTRRQLGEMEADAGVHLISTDGRSVEEVARVVLELAGWVG